MSKQPLRIQEALRKGGDLDKLCVNHSIRYIQHPKYPNLMWFMHKGYYLQYPFTSQCRGLILDRDDNWSVVARPLDEIPEWNYNYAPQFDWGAKVKPRVFDKVDGVMVYTYYIKGSIQAWFAGSRKSPIANNQVDGAPLHEVFWKTFDAMKYRVPPPKMQDYTFIWELVGPRISPVLTSRAPRDRNQLALLAIRHNETGDELDTTEWCSAGDRDYIDVFEDTSRFKSIEEVAQVVQETGLKAGEGYVVVGPDYQRVVVTHPDYDTARQFRQQLSLAHLVKHARSREVHDSLLKFAPDWVPLHTIVAKSYVDLIKRVWAARKRHSGVLDNDLYEKVVAQYPWSEVLIKIRRLQQEAAPGAIKVTVSEVLQEMDPAEVLGWLEVPGTDDQAEAA